MVRKTTMLKVLVGQKKWYVENDKIIVTNELAKVDVKDKNGKKIGEMDAIGGVVEDNLFEILGYVFDPDLYDQNMVRKPETFIYDWQFTPTL